jgi:hypothetical protein
VLVTCSVTHNAHLGSSLTWPHAQSRSAASIVPRRPRVFESVPHTPSQTCPQVELSRFDLFHCHIFVTADGTPGLLFHASEYPAPCHAFPYNLGYCQVKSPLRFSQARLDWRNYVWFEVRSHPLAVVLCPIASHLPTCEEFAVSIHWAFVSTRPLPMGEPNLACTAGQSVHWVLGAAKQPPAMHTTDVGAAYRGPWWRWT